LPEIISNTSPLQYLHQLGVLDWLPQLADRIVVPTAVVQELEAGLALGIGLPDVQSLSWIRIQDPNHAEQWRTVSGLGPGESAALALAVEMPGITLLLDDCLARRMAGLLKLPIRGTLGVLLDAKAAGLTKTVKPLIDQLQKLGFRCSPTTRNAVLSMAGE
jgi:predicted nucleic acid-binding protein